MPAPKVDMLDASDTLLLVTSTPNDTVDFDDSGCAPDTSMEPSRPSENHILTSEIYPRSEVTRRSHDTTFGPEAPSAPEAILTQLKPGGRIS